MTDTSKLALAIEKSGLSTLDISRKTRIPFGNCVRLIKGEKSFTSKEIDRFCEVLTIPVADRSDIFFAK